MKARRVRACLMPLSMRRTACGDCPCPSAIVVKVTPFCSASCSNWLVGSTPGDSTKISGDVAIESDSTELRSSTW